MDILALLFSAALAQQTPCEALKMLTLPKASITAAESVAAGPQQGGRGGQTMQLPAHCRVSIALTPSADSRIDMELWLPAENWNGNFLALGNGGWAGNIERAALAAGLSRGYAAASNDTGHKGGSASFALGHPEKVIDFGYRAMHEMAVQSKLVIQAYYKRAPRLSYYQGCSTGGRQGLMAAQRYPGDFDAIVAGAPVYNQIHLNESQVARQVAMLRDPARLVPASKVTLFAGAVMAACDPQDGVKDGIISQPRRCTFDPSVLACKAGDAPDCLTASQVAAAKSVYLPVTTKSGALVYPGHSAGFESAWRIPSPGAAMNPLWSDMPRYIGRQDPNWDVMSFDLDVDLALAIKNAGFIEAADPDLSKFKARGGKLLLYHGWADPGPAPENTINYWSSVVSRMGGQSQNDWMRLFLMPGVGHCAGGVGPDQADFLGAIERWRDAGAAPDQIVATRGAGRGGQPGMTRPLCPFPQVEKYKGTGSTNDAASFVCAAP